MSFHAGQSFTFGETPSATKWNYLWENDYALADGTGISDDAIITRHIADGAVKPSNIDLDPSTNYVGTDQSTTSTSYADLSTVQAVTVPVGANGLALVIWSLGSYNVAAVKNVSVAVSGATTLAASDNYMTRNDASSFAQIEEYTHLFTGLTPGNNTFTMKFKTASGTARFFHRRITAIPL